MPAAAPTAVEILENLDAFPEVIDVRSPAEFAEDHIPGAVNCPVLDNDERHEVGSLHKHDPFAARRLGAVLVAQHIAVHLRTRWQDRPRSWKPLCYCWRGGQRSGSLVYVLRAVGWAAQPLPGGYKAYRRHVRQRLETLPQKLRWCVVAGETGSGKSRLLEALQRRGAQVLHLEQLAHHRGSLLGGEVVSRPSDAVVSQPSDAVEPQPSQKKFETSLWAALEKFSAAQPVFVEAESRRTGKLTLPATLWECLRAAPCVRLEASRAARCEFLLCDYPHLLTDSRLLHAAFASWRGRHGQARLANWHELLQRQEYGALVEQLLIHHYDPLYQQSLPRLYRGYDRALRVPMAQLSANSIEAAASEVLAQLQTAQIQLPTPTHP